MKTKKLGNWKIQKQNSKIKVYYKDQYICSFQQVDKQQITDQTLYQIIFDKSLLLKRNKNKSFLIFE